MSKSAEVGPAADQDLRTWLSQTHEIEPADLIDVLQRDQQQRWRRGERIPVETYLQLCPALAGPGEEILDLVVGEFLLRQERGESPKLEEYLWRFPHLAGAIRAEFELDRLLAHDAGDTPNLRRDQTMPLAPTWDGVRPLVPGYESLGELGRGGMGVVYKARHLALDRIVALKMLQAGPEAAPADLVRFRSEAEAVARLQHANIVQVYEVGEHQGQPFFALEFLEGGSLADQLDGTPWSAVRAAPLVETLARAVHAAHQGGIIHRDLKPANVLLTADGTPKLTDFGLAKRVGGDSGLTQTGAIVGTPSYMPPEQAAARRDLGPTADVYALGAILYELLTGRPPFRAETVVDTLLQVLNEEPVRPGRLQPTMPRDVETIILKCLEKDPHRRYATAELLADDLRRFLEGRPVSARPASAVERAVKWARRRPAVAGLLSALVIVALSGFALVLWQWREAVHQTVRADERALAASNATIAARENEAREKAARKEKEHVVAGFILDQGIHLCERAEVDRGMLVLARALEHAVRLEDRDLERVARANLAAWRPRLFRERARFTHKDWVWVSAFSPDDRTVVTASRDKTARLWDALTGQPHCEPLRHAHPVWAVAFSPDGKRLLTGSGASDGSHCEARLWDATTGALERIIPLASAAPIPKSSRQDYTPPPVSAVAFGPDGTTFLTVGLRETRLWTTATGEPVGPSLPHPGLIFAGALSSDGQRVLTAGADASARLWNAADGQPIGNPMMHRSAIRVATFSADGRLILTGSEDSTAQLWDAAGGRRAGPALKHLGPVWAGAFSADGRLVATGGRAMDADRNEKPMNLFGEARVWHTDTGALVGKPLFHTGPVRSVALTPTGAILLTGGEDLHGHIFAVTSGTALTKSFNLDNPIRSVALSSDGRRGLVSGVGGNTPAAHLWDLPEETDLGRPLAQPGFPDRLAFSPDSRFLASTDGFHIRLWDLAGTRKDSMRNLEGWSTGIAFSPDGTRLAATSTNEKVWLWDRADDRLLHRWPRAHSVMSIAYAADGKSFITGEGKGVVQRWNAVTGEAIGPPLQHGGTVWTVALSPDGRRALSGGSDRICRLWDLETNKEVRRWEHTATVHAVAFSPDGATVMNVAVDRLPQFHDATTGELKYASVARQAGPVWWAAFSPDGGSLLTASGGVARLWDLATAKPLGPPRSHGATIGPVIITPDGRHAATGGRDNKIRLWDLPPPLSADAADVRRWVEAITGLEFDAQENIRTLGPEILPQRQNEVRRRGGSLAADALLR